MQRVVSAVMWEGVTLFVVGLVLGICYGKRQCPLCCPASCVPIWGNPAGQGAPLRVPLSQSAVVPADGATHLGSSSPETHSVIPLHCAGRLSDSCWAPPHTSDAATPLPPAPHHHCLPREQCVHGLACAACSSPSQD